MFCIPDMLPISPSPADDDCPEHCLEVEELIFMPAMSLMSMPAIPLSVEDFGVEGALDACASAFGAGMPAIFIPSMFPIPISAIVRIGRGSISGIGADIPALGASVARA